MARTHSTGTTVALIVVAAVVLYAVWGLLQPYSVTTSQQDDV